MYRVERWTGYDWIEELTGTFEDCALYGIKNHDEKDETDLWRITPLKQ